MIGNHRDGGYAELLKIPGRSALAFPDDIPFEHAAIMMCSSATSFHALRKVRIKSGESVAIFGYGGLGFSALQLAKALECGPTFVVEINPAKLGLIATYGGLAIDPKQGDPVKQIRDATDQQGVDVSLELIGSARTMEQAVRCLRNLGRAALVGLTSEVLGISPYAQLINKEVEIIGVSDHLAAELPALIDFARRGMLRFPHGTVHNIPLDAGAINSALDSIATSTDQIRTVITP
jgi:D-arabinose 1-dehydrogenase-like Zn-dependent alcohol dehydrogenase